MRPSIRAVLVALLAGACWLGLAPTTAGAEIAYKPCAETNDFACGHLVVPLDPSGAIPGTLTIALRRHRAPIGEARSAIVALAGGPGQPALPFAEVFAELLGPLAATRDLIVFDQRGVGLSGPLSCHAFERPDLFHSLGALVSACGAELGAARSLYTTADTVADIEAIREAGGYEKLVLYGTSYGTKVAEEYAQRYPSHVEGLVLDSVVPPEGPEAFDQDTFAAIPRVLRQVCLDGVCDHVTRNPAADLARVVARIHHEGLRGRYIDENGHPHSVAISAGDLLEILLAGDFLPELRGEFVTAVRAAAQHDTAPLARLLATASSGEGEQEDFDMPLFYATSCEEQSFPWNRASSPGARIGQALAAAEALPGSSFAPFDARDALALGDAEGCAYWPNSGAAPPPADAPLPNVPTLLLSGADDLRTPTSGARLVAGEIPDAKLLVVPYTGHSVLTAETGSCAHSALERLFSSGAPKPCRAGPPPAALRPPPLPPTRLAEVAPSRGVAGLPGRTLHAVTLSLSDLLGSLQLELALDGDDSEEGLVVIPTLRAGGLRAGWTEFADERLELHGYSYVPGVTISGTIASSSIELRVAGAAAAAGVFGAAGRAAHSRASSGVTPSTYGEVRNRLRLLSETMPRRAPTLVLAALLSSLALASSPASSAASPLSYGPCADTSEFNCATLPVPLDRAGAAAGTISLAVERKLAGSVPSESAVVALAGGPGQAVLPLGEFIAAAIAPALGARDLLLFDQRGTGSSHPLSCPALEGIPSGSLATLFERCALQIGSARGGYTTAESVQDLEALREAGGYKKLVLYGTSYGTKVALEYAERYPQYVEALVLDSVVPTTGPEPFAIPSFEAVAGVLEELCADGACAGITSNPVADVATLATQLQHRALGGSVYDGSGKRHPVSIDELGLLQILEAGDLNPALRALLPAAVHSALHHDPDPLLRLHLLSEGLIPSIPDETPGVEGAPEIDEALFATTSCEETLFPWQREAAPSTRLTEALGYLHAQPSSAFYPFDPTTAYQNSLVGDCASWPDASLPPTPPVALPNVPTLILSGEQDMRTPTSSARTVAAQIPDSQLLVVPFTGHSVLGSDLSGCAAGAVSTFFSGGVVQPCTGTQDEFAPTPVTPTRLASMRAPGGLAGKPGKTLAAVVETLVDLNRQVISATLEADAELPSGSSFGGLRGGFAKLTAAKAVLKNFSFVEGVTLTGTFPVHDGALQPATIRIGGNAASGGTVRLGALSRKVTGTLGGRRFAIGISDGRLARAGAGGWPSAGAIASLLRRSGGAAGASRGPLQVP